MDRQEDPQFIKGFAGPDAGLLTIVNDGGVGTALYFTKCGPDNVISLRFCQMHFLSIRKGVQYKNTPFFVFWFLLDIHTGSITADKVISICQVKFGSWSGWMCRVYFLKFLYSCLVTRPFLLFNRFPSGSVSKTGFSPFFRENAWGSGRILFKRSNMLRRQSSSNTALTSPFLYAVRRTSAKCCGSGSTSGCHHTGGCKRFQQAVHTLPVRRECGKISALLLFSLGNTKDIKSLLLYCIHNLISLYLTSRDK